MDAVATCLKPNQLERELGIDQAIQLYEQDISNNTDENNAFERLAIIYRSHGKIADEIRVLEKAVAFYEYVVFIQHLDSRLATLNAFTSRLKQARSLLPTL
jgi:tetratricopeptide (TPR) repeat protein